MPNLLNQDDQTMTFQGSDGKPFTVAKSALSPDYVSQFTPTQNQSVMPQASPVGFLSQAGMQSDGSYAAPPQPTATNASMAPQVMPGQNLPLQPQVTPQTTVESQASTSGIAPGDKSAIQATNQKINNLGQQSMDLANEQSGIQDKLANEYTNAAKAQDKSAADLQSWYQGKQTEIEQRKQSLDQQAKDLSNVKMQDFWADKSGGQKALAAVAIALGSIGTAFGGGPNVALSIIDNTMARDAEIQKQNYNIASNNLKEKNNLYAQTVKQVGDEFLAQKMLANAKLEGLKTQTEAYAAQSNSAEIKQKALAFNAGIQERIMANQAAIADHVTNTEMAKTDSGKGAIAPPSEAESKSAGFAARMTDAEKGLAEIRKAGYQSEDLSSGIGSKLPNAVRTKEAVRQEALEKNFATAILKDEGTRINNPKIVDETRDMYFPRVGDDAKTVADKSKARAQAIRMNQVGAGSKALQQQQGAAPDYASQAAGLGLKPVQ